MAEYSDAMRELAQKLLRVVSESLSLAPSFIEEAIGEVYQNITVSFYPPCPQPELALGLQSHSDMGAITLLIQDDVGGLEVLKDGLWIPIVPLPGAVVVILADQTEVDLPSIATDSFNSPRSRRRRAGFLSDCRGIFFFFFFFADYIER